MPRRSMKQRKQRGGGYNRPSEYFGVSSGQYLDANDHALTPRASNPAVARAEIPVRGNGGTELTHIQTGGGYYRPHKYFGVSSGQYLDANDSALTPRASNPAVARAEIPVRGNGGTGLTHIQTGGAGGAGGARKRRSRRRNHKVRNVLSRRRRATHQSRRRRNRRTRARQVGGAVRMPTEYFGRDSKAYTGHANASASTDTNLARNALDISGEVTGLQTGGGPGGGGTETTDVKEIENKVENKASIIATLKQELQKAEAMALAEKAKAAAEKARADAEIAKREQIEKNIAKYEKEIAESKERYNRAIQSNDARIKSY